MEKSIKKPINKLPLNKELIIKAIDLMDMIKNMELNIQRYKNRLLDQLLTMNDRELVELSKTIKRREGKE